MSSSGLIYAVIVGAWAAYLVPMWLRRQDELNEARPTERFSTAIRLLSGRAAMERKISRQLEETQPLAVPSPPAGSSSGPDDTDRERAFDEDAGGDADADGFFVPSAGSSPQSVRSSFQPSAQPTPPAAVAGHLGGPSPAVASRRRAALLARRRRMVVILFVAFTAGMVGAAVGGVALLWIPAVPAVLFSLYIAQMRRQEHRRYEVKLDRRRAVEAAQRVRRQAAERREAATAAMAVTEAARADRAPRPARPAAEAEAQRPARGADGGGHASAPTTSGTGALGDGSGHAGTAGPAATARRPRVPGTTGATGAARVPGVEGVESWADHDAPERGGAAPSSAAGRDDGWEPVPVPLPTYVTAPVAPRATLGLDLSAPDTYSSARGRQAGQNPQAQPAPQQAPATPPRRPAPKPTTPLFDQYADDTPRAANE